jgi:hypothetical protein
MSDTLEEAKEAVERRRRSDRRQWLFHILELILDGKIDSSKTPLADIFNQRGPRQSYVSPKDRATRNYGYMEFNEMLAGTPFYGES